MIVLQCRDCQTEIQRPDGDAGKTIFCPKCYFALIVPQSTQRSVSAPDHRFQMVEPTNNDTSTSLPNEYVIVCPQCFRSTDSLKAIEFQNVLFAIIFIGWNREYVIGCPKCVRSVLLSRMLVAIPAANVLFPIYGFIYLLKYVEVGSKGHSDLGVAHAHRMPVSRYLDQVRLEKPASGSRTWPVAVILILVICGIAYMVTSRLMRGW